MHFMNLEEERTRGSSGQYIVKAITMNPVYQMCSPVIHKTNNLQSKFPSSSSLLCFKRAPPLKSRKFELDEKTHLHSMQCKYPT